MSTCPMPTCQTTAGCVCAAAAQFGHLDLGLIRLAYLEEALRDIARADCWTMTGDAAAMRCAKIARDALQKSDALT